MNKGCVQVYTGDGKGKTTAALGLALRAAGAGLHVWFGQFMKLDGTSEMRALARFDDLVATAHFGVGDELAAADRTADAAAAHKGVKAALDALRSGRYDVVVLDEANVAAHLGYITEAELRAILDARAPGAELVFTGRYAPQLLLDAADLVTEMRLVKHYFDAGVPARTGIEM